MIGQRRFSKWSPGNRKDLIRHTELSLDIIQAADLFRKGALESIGVRVELGQVSRDPSSTLKNHQLTSLNCTWPTSPKALTTSLPISLAM